MIAGAVAGLVGSFAMTRFEVAVSACGLTGAEEPQSNKPVDGRDDAATKAADLAARPTTGRALTRQEKTKVGGQPLSGATWFGAAVSALADQLALPGTPRAATGSGRRRR